MAASPDLAPDLSPIGCCDCRLLLPLVSLCYSKMLPKCTCFVSNRLTVSQSTHKSAGSDSSNAKKKRGGGGGAVLGLTGLVVINEDFGAGGTLVSSTPCCPLSDDTSSSFWSSDHHLFWMSSQMLQGQPVIAHIPRGLGLGL